MNKLTLGLAALTLTAASFLAGIAAADGQSFDDALLSIQHEFDQASFSGLTGSDRKDAFATLVEHAADFSARFPDRPEAVAWNGIVLSTYAGEVSAMSAMRYAKAARTALHEAESMAPEALDGGLYASLGALFEGAGRDDGFRRRQARSRVLRQGTGRRSGEYRFELLLRRVPARAGGLHERDSRP
jgi:hypothetical protein